MTNIELDASEWVAAVDFHTALLTALGAPKWHGTSTNALIDSMIYGGINDVTPPFRVNVRGMREAGEAARAAFQEAFDALGDAGANCSIAADGMASIEVIDTIY